MTEDAKRVATTSARVLSTASAACCGVTTVAAWRYYRSASSDHLFHFSALSWVAWVVLLVATFVVGAQDAPPVVTAVGVVVALTASVVVLSISGIAVAEAF